VQSTWPVTVTVATTPSQQTAIWNGWLGSWVVVFTPGHLPGWDGMMQQTAKREREDLLAGLSAASIRLVAGRHPVRGTGNGSKTLLGLGLPAGRPARRAFEEATVTRTLRILADEDLVRVVSRWGTFRA
jgi:hypothetical protein